MVDIDVLASSHLKKLAWAADEQLQVISAIMLFQKQLEY